VIGAPCTDGVTITALQIVYPLEVGLGQTASTIRYAEIFEAPVWYTGPLGQRQPCQEGVNILDRLYEFEP
jgi:predicted aldo/keto reductase-like oxidoreductase